MRILCDISFFVLFHENPSLSPKPLPHSQAAVLVGQRSSSRRTLYNCCEAVLAIVFNVYDADLLCFHVHIIYKTR